MSGRGRRPRGSRMELTPEGCRSACGWCGNREQIRTNPEAGGSAVCLFFVRLDYSEIESFLASAAPLWCSAGFSHQCIEHSLRPGRDDVQAEATGTSQVARLNIHWCANFQTRSLANEPFFRQKAGLVAVVQDVSLWSCAVSSFSFRAAS